MSVCGVCYVRWGGMRWCGAVRGAGGGRHFRLTKNDLLVDGVLVAVLQSTLNIHH